jgi:glucosylglycerate synthase
VAAIAEISQPAREHLDQIGAAELVIGLLAPATPETLEGVVARTRESIASLQAPVRTVLIHPGPSSDHGAPPDANTGDSFRILAIPALSPQVPGDPAQATRAACDTVFAVATNLGARAAAVIISDLDGVTAQWIYRMVRPVLELDFDLVTPCYTHARFEGLLNSAIVAPLTRALYGRRFENPLGPDFGVSGRLARRFAENAAPARDPRSLASLAVDALSQGFEICQAKVGVRHYPPTDWTNQSSVLAPILDPVFREMEHRASFWQRIRGSQAVPAFGDTVRPADTAAAPPDTRRMFESFELGCRDLQELWRVVLPPGTVLELTKLSRQPFDTFQMPDRLWAHLIYDFALGYRLRTLNADHLLRAMTPLYLAWVASYARETDVSDGDASAERLEKLALAFEEAKPYALSRWRWPDRFNP